MAGEPLGDAGRLRRRPRLRLPARPGQRRRGRRRQGGGAGSRRAPRRDARRSTGRPTSGASSSSPSSRPPWPAGCSASTRSTSPTSRRPRTTRRRCWRRASCPAVDAGRPRTSCSQAAAPPKYVAIMAYVEPSDEFDAAIAELRAKLRDSTKATTTFGYGPRFLHSTGQYHKGGPPTGLFLQLVHDGDEDVEIPERRLRLPTPEERAGDRRPADAARPRPAGGADPARGRPR